MCPTTCRRVKVAVTVKGSKTEPLTISIIINTYESVFLSRSSHRTAGVTQTSGEERELEGFFLSPQSQREKRRCFSIIIPAAVSLFWHCCTQEAVDKAVPAVGCRVRPP